MYKDDRITITIRRRHADLVRQMEIFCNKDGRRNPWIYILLPLPAILAVAVLGLALGDPESVIGMGLMALLYLVYPLVNAINVLRQQKERRVAYEEEKNKPDEEEKYHFSVCFGRGHLFLRFTGWDNAIPYEQLARFVEYSDGLYLEVLSERDVTFLFIPARFISAHDAAEIVFRVRSCFKRATCISQLRPGEPVQKETPAEDLFDFSRHKLLCEVEYTLTSEEVSAVSSRKMCCLAARKTVLKAHIVLLVTCLILAVFAALVFSIAEAAGDYVTAGLLVLSVVMLVAAMYLGSFSTSKMQRRFAEAERKYGGRMALYEDVACVRLLGDDVTVMYNWLYDVFRTTEFAGFRNSLFGTSGKTARVFHAVPLRAAENADEFVRILEERIQAAREGRIRPVEAVEPTILEMDETEPLREDDSKGREILSARFLDMDVSIRRKLRVTELIINGGVYAEKRELIQGPYELTAKVDGVVFCAVQQADGIVQLFAQGMEIAAGLHNIS